ncbi:MAG: hypothetical protein R3268_07355 [Acidiferrobacterales bacterium]|nr:hypothetical protein [Acidiferrobacterales bacterium]
MLRYPRNHGKGRAHARRHLVLKVKEPIAAEYGLLRDDRILFCFLHLAANAELALVLKDLTAVAFETVEEEGQLPILAPMSEIAGRLAVQIGSVLLHTPGWRGLLLGGLPATERGHVVVLGAAMSDVVPSARPRKWSHR